MADVLQSFLTQAQQPNLPDANARAGMIASSIQNGAIRLVQQMVQQRTQLYNAFWNTPGVIPQLISTALGNIAISVFTRDAQLVAFITAQLTSLGATSDQIIAIVPGIPKGYTVTPNQDGTVTITQDA